MRSRRRFLELLAGAVAGAVGGSLPRGVFGQPVRKRVDVGGLAATVVDVHAHCMIPEVGALLAGSDFAGRVFPDALTLGPGRLEEMDARGIDIQALSINAFWWYEAERELAGDIVSLHDRALATWCREHADRFVALSSVALQYPELAAEQLEYAVRELGHRGAAIGGHVDGEQPSSPRFDPFWAKAEELGVPVFMHPNNAFNVARPDGLSGRGNLGNIIGNPLETTVFLTHMIFDGTLDRFPSLKLCAAHGGGYLPSYLGRTEAACAVREAADCMNQRPPRAYFKDQILVDSMVFSSEGLRHLIAETAPSQVVYGSDIPYPWPDTIDLIADAWFLAENEKRAILGMNLIALLGIELPL